jgi:hypothetical protein
MITRAISWAVVASLSISVLKDIGKSVIDWHVHKGLDHVYSDKPMPAAPNTYQEYFSPAQPKTKAPKYAYRGTTYDTSTPSYTDSIDYSTPLAKRGASSAGDYVSAPDFGSSFYSRRSSRGK